MANSVDVLVVDEAGQMSLADVLSISQATTSVILLGDPQQLNQPQRGVHPPGVDVSALAHLLGGRATIEPGKGLFLKESWRLHPEICAFTSELFYDGRLAARPENQKQRLNTKGVLDGSGLRFVPAPHTGNQNESPEEVEKIAELIGELLGSGASWTKKTGETVPLKPPDILVVALYNAQVSELGRRLPGIRVGTVDKFQGQEAPLVFYSMATSTPEDAPKGMEFLYSLNRVYWSWWSSGERILIDDHDRHGVRSTGSAGASTVFRRYNRPQIRWPPCRPRALSLLSVFPSSLLP